MLVLHKIVIIRLKNVCYTYVKAVNFPIRIFDTSSGPSTINNKINHWFKESTQPPLLISFNNNLAVLLPMSSGVSPGKAACSEQYKTPVLDSATRFKANPGDLPDSSPLRTSVKMYTSGIYLFNTDLAESTNLLAFCGDTLVEHAIPRIRFILPSSVNCIGFNDLIIGHLKLTSPPPKGADPRLII